MISYPNGGSSCYPSDFNGRIDGIKIVGVSSLVEMIQKYKEVFGVGSLVSFTGQPNAFYRCVDIRDGKYVFCSEEQMAKPVTHDDLKAALRDFWDSDMIPKRIKKEIGHVFIASYKNVVGDDYECCDRYEDDGEDNYQYEYFKQNEAHRVKNRRNIDKHRWDTEWWWLSSGLSAVTNATAFAGVGSLGDAGRADASYARGVVPFFSVTVED